MARNHDYVEELEKRELRALSESELGALYQYELKETFPPMELKPLYTMERLRDKGRYEALGLFQGPFLQGYALMWMDERGQYPLLDYLGVPEEMRGRGQGAEVLRLLRTRYPEAKGIIAEAEAPEAAADEAERTLRQRRLRFYDRCGFTTLPFDCGLFGVHYRVLVCPIGAVDAGEALAVHTRRYQEHFKPEIYAQCVQLPLKAGEEVRPFTAWKD